MALFVACLRILCAQGPDKAPHVQRLQVRIRDSVVRHNDVLGKVIVSCSHCIVVYTSHDVRLSSSAEVGICTRRWTRSRFAWPLSAPAWRVL